jgi:hypothetical protein
VLQGRRLMVPAIARGPQMRKRRRVIVFRLIVAWMGGESVEGAPPYRVLRADESEVYGSSGVMTAAGTVEGFVMASQNHKNVHQLLNSLNLQQIVASNMALKFLVNVSRVIIFIHTIPPFVNYERLRSSCKSSRLT